MNRKIKIIFGIIGIVIVVFTIWWLWFAPVGFWLTPYVKPCGSDCGPDTQVTDWKTYANEEYGFEFKYPPDAIISDISDEQNLVFLGFSVLFNSSYNTWINKSLSVLVVKEKCDVISGSSSKTINSIDFAFEDKIQTDGVLGHSANRQYRTEHNGYCYYFNERLVGPGPKAKEYPTKETVQIPPNLDVFFTDELDILDQIISTVKFIN